jgi:hypothetical protein
MMLFICHASAVYDPHSRAMLGASHGWCVSPSWPLKIHSLPSIDPARLNFLVNLNSQLWVTIFSTRLLVE